LFGAPIGDRVGPRQVIRLSIAGVAPCTLMLSQVDLGTSATGPEDRRMLARAFTAMVVHGRALLPGTIGTVSWLFFGVASRMAGIGAAALGQLADHWGIAAVSRLCPCLPPTGLSAVLLPDLQQDPLQPDHCRKGATRSNNTTPRHGSIITATCLFVVVVVAGDASGSRRDHNLMATFVAHSRGAPP